MYVDDFLGESDLVDSAQVLVRDFQNVVKTDGYYLIKRVSNFRDAIRHLLDSLKAFNSSDSIYPHSSQRT